MSSCATRRKFVVKLCYKEEVVSSCATRRKLCQVVLQGENQPFPRTSRTY